MLPLLQIKEMRHAEIYLTFAIHKASELQSQSSNSSAINHLGPALLWVVLSLRDFSGLTSPVAKVRGHLETCLDYSILKPLSLYLGNFHFIQNSFSTYLHKSSRVAYTLPINQPLSEFPFANGIIQAEHHTCW